MLSRSPARAFTTGMLLLPIALFYGCSDAPTPLAPHIATAPHDLLETVVTVTNTDDDGPGSLRQAINDAPDGATIRFDAAIAGQTILVKAGFMPIPKSLTIEGSLPAGMTISGNLSNRVFRVEQHVTVVLRNLSIVNGRFVNGAGVLNQGTLTLDHVLLANNETTGDGGGLETVGATTLTTVLNSTITGNLARRGGGIAANRPMIIRNSTIADNTASQGGGIFFLDLDGDFNIRNSIVANNIDNDLTDSATPNCSHHLDVAGVLTGTTLSNDDSCGTGLGMIIANPMLAPLASNGGPTMTRALLVGSPAIDGGTVCSEATDQRYVARPQGATCDIGAFELDKLATVTLTIGPNVAVNTKTGVATVTGTAACSVPGIVRVDVALSQTQKTNGKFSTIIQAAGTTSANCIGTSSWSVTLTPATGKFESGSATGTVKTSTASGFLPASVTSALKAFAAK